MSGNIGLIVLNLILVAMLILAWQLWRQSVPKRRKVKAVEVADWPSGPSDMHAAGSQTHGIDAPAAQAGMVAPQLVAAGAPGVSAEQAPVGYDSTAVDYAAAPVAVPEQADMQFAPPVAPAPAAPSQVAPVQPAPVQPAAVQPAPAPASPVIAGNGTIDDDELAALLDSAPPTSSAPVGLFAQPTAGNAPSGFAAPPSPAAPASLFHAPAPAPVSSLAPPVAPAGAVSGSIGDDVSRQVGALLAAPRPAAQPVSSLAAPTSVQGATSDSVQGTTQTSVSTTDRLRLDITGRPVDDVMRSLVTRLGEMGYSVQTGPLGETVFQRGTTESIRIAVSAKEAASTDADGRPLPARADIEVVGGQLQETTEAVLFELIDHGFQLRWAVAGELVLSSFDGALARVNVNPTSSD